jgi:hypothetical protein
MRFAHNQSALNKFGLMHKWLEWQLLKRSRNHNTKKEILQEVYNRMKFDTFDFLDFKGRWLQNHPLLSSEVWRNLPLDINMLRTGSGVSNAIAARPAKADRNNPYITVFRPESLSLKILVMPEEFKFPLNESILFTGILYMLAVPSVHLSTNKTFCTFLILNPRLFPEEAPMVTMMEQLVLHLKRETGVLMPKKVFYAYGGVTVFLFRSMGSTLHELIFTPRELHTYDADGATNMNSVKCMAIVEMVIAIHTMQESKFYHG